MAEGTSVATSVATSTSTSSTEEVDKDKELCAVCLEPYVHPAKLPCGHVFCFLCIKGTANRSKRCAMCRQEIPHDFVEKPNLLSNKFEESCVESNYQWYYEGRNGWWQYDERTSKEIETAYKKGEKTCELLVAGFLYVMDLEAMLQLRRNDPTRRRRIKRDLTNIDKIGIAGLRCAQPYSSIPAGSAASATVVKPIENASISTVNTVTNVFQESHNLSYEHTDSDSDILTDSTTEIDSQATIICDSANSSFLYLPSDTDEDELD